MATKNRPSTRPTDAQALRASSTHSSTRALKRQSHVESRHDVKPRASVGLAAYEREVRRELEKKIGKAKVPTDIYSKAYLQIIERSFKADVHPVAAAGVLTIVSGFAPDRAPPSGLCCGQR